jgi:hypothetical protein
MVTAVSGSNITLNRALTADATGIDFEVQRVDKVTTTVTDPATGDQEIVTLTETGPNTSIFTNQGGASRPVSNNWEEAWIPFVKTSVIADDETWTLTYVNASGTWTVCGSVSGCEASNATAGTEFTSADGSIIFTIREDAPSDGDTIVFHVFAGDRLLNTPCGGCTPTLDDGSFSVDAGDTIWTTYTNSEDESVSDDALIIGGGTPYIQFTRINGLPTDTYTLDATEADSDDIYVTVTYLIDQSSSDPDEDPNDDFDETAVDTITITVMAHQR